MGYIWHTPYVKDYTYIVWWNDFYWGKTSYKKGSEVLLNAPAELIAGSTYIKTRSLPEPAQLMEAVIDANERKVFLWVSPTSKPVGQGYKEWDY